MSFNSRLKATKNIGQRKVFKGREFQGLDVRGKKLSTSLQRLGMVTEKNAVYQNNE